MISTNPIWAGWLSSYLGHIATLAKHFRVIVPDFRGSGRTVHPGGPISYNLLADDMVTVSSPCCRTLRSGSAQPPCRQRSSSSSAGSKARADRQARGPGGGFPADATAAAGAQTCGLQLASASRWSEPAVVLSARWCGAGKVLRAQAPAAGLAPLCAAPGTYVHDH